MEKMSLDESDLLVAIEKSMQNAESLIADADLLATNLVASLDARGAPAALVGI